jgi:hypothetical protein
MRRKPTLQRAPGPPADLRLGLTIAAGCVTQEDERTTSGILDPRPTDPVGRLLFNVLAMVTEFESDLIRRRTREGMKVAKANGAPGATTRAALHRYIRSRWPAGETEIYRPRDTPVTATYGASV